MTANHAAERPTTVVVDFPVASNGNKRHRVDIVLGPIPFSRPSLPHYSPPVGPPHPLRYPPSQPLPSLLRPLLPRATLFAALMHVFRRVSCPSDVASNHYPRFAACYLAG